MRAVPGLAGCFSVAVLAVAGTLRAAPPAPPAPPPAAARAEAPVDRSGVVLVEQAGRVVALGTVLDGDGRVVTALSRVGGTAPVFVRYADGRLDAARVGHSDRVRDLALLVPKTARWKRGLKAARNVVPLSTKALTGFSVGANRAVVPGPRAIKAGVGRGFELDTAPKLEELGGPLLDTQGNAVAILVSSCAGASNPAPCGAPPIALPVPQVRSFLRELPTTAAFTLPWLGIEGASADTGVVRGLRITQIEPRSPAAALGLRAGGDFGSSDLLVAVGGEPVPTPEALRSALSRHAPGARVDLLVFGNGSYRTLAARLGDRPAGQNTSTPASPPAPGSAMPASGSERK